MQKSRVSQVTADTITDEQARMLAKVRCAEHLSMKIREPISRALSDLAYGKNKPTTLLDLKHAGLVGWDNGSILTEKGSALLTELLHISAAKAGAQ